jgi:hypothetical protein
MNSFARLMSVDTMVLTSIKVNIYFFVVIVIQLYLLFNSNKLFIDECRARRFI